MDGERAARRHAGATADAGRRTEPERPAHARRKGATLPRQQHQDAELEQRRRHPEPPGQRPEVANPLQLGRQEELRRVERRQAQPGHLGAEQEPRGNAPQAGTYRKTE